MANSRKSSFGGEKRFSFPSKSHQNDSRSSIYHACISIILAASKHRAPAPSRYSPKTYWKMDAAESIRKNSGAHIFSKGKTDILQEKYHIKEKM